MSMIDLKALERKVWRSSFQDGFWDLFIGIMVLGFAVIPLINDVMHSDFWSSFAWLPINLVALLLLYLGKRYITTPRIGLTRPDPRRKRRLTLLAGINVAVLSLGVVAGAVTAVDGGKALLGIYPYFVGLMILAIFSVCAYLFRVQRFYLYGLLLVLAPTIGDTPLLRSWPATAFHHGYPVTFGSIAVMIIITGIVLLVRFIRATPRPIKETVGGP
ncbi:MAG: hypothetical protein JSW54_09600 [Fidelibacterota bacterium]|nr:MAG: hypothetical protein JSW54_09600 [Candidatus Neomarinimicrobiota bacterium]